MLVLSHIHFFACWSTHVLLYHVLQVSLSPRAALSLTGVTTASARVGRCSVAPDIVNSSLELGESNDFKPFIRVN